MIKIEKIKNVDVVLLARHGRKHEIPPTQFNYIIESIKEFFQK